MIETTNKSSNQEEIKLVDSNYSYSIDLDSLNDSLNKDHEELKEKLKSEIQYGVPVFFPSVRGTYIFRVYLDVSKETGRQRFYKLTSIHRLLCLDEDGKENKVNVVESDRVNKKLSALEVQLDKKTFNKNFFRFKPVENAYLLTKLYHCPESQYLKPNTYGIMVLNQKQIKSISEFVYSMSNQEKINFFDMRKPYFAIKIEVKVDEKGYNPEISNISFTESEFELGNLVLPEGVEFESLDKVYINESQNKITDEQFFSFEKLISKRLYDNKLSSEYGLKDTTSYIDDEIPSSFVKSTNDRTCLLKEQGLNDNGEDFENPPSEEHPLCSICPNQALCYKNKK